MTTSDERYTAFSILLRPCRSCGDAIPQGGVVVCAVCETQEAHNVAQSK